MNYDEAALQAVRERRLLIDRCDAWLFESLEPYLGQRILDVGCGLGNLLKHLVDRELAIGSDVEATSVDYVNQNFYQEHVQAYECDVTASEFLELSRFNFDTAVSLNVFEHIEDDGLAMKHVHEVLQPGGVFVLIVPAHQWLYGPMDSSIGHYRRYSLAELNEKLTNVGFEIKEQKYVNPIGGLGWFVSGRILRRKVPPVGQLNLFNRIMPLVKTLDSNLPLPFGLSAVTIAERSQKNGD